MNDLTGISFSPPPFLKASFQRVFDKKEPLRLSAEGSFMWCGERGLWTTSTNTLLFNYLEYAIHVAGYE